MPRLSQQESLIEDTLKFYFNVVEDDITGNHFYNFNVHKPFTNDLTKLLNQEEDGVFLAHQFVTRNNSSSLLFSIPVYLPVVLICLIILIIMIV